VTLIVYLTGIKPPDKFWQLNEHAYIISVCTLVCLCNTHSLLWIDCCDLWYVIKFCLHYSVLNGLVSQRKVKEMLSVGSQKWISKWLMLCCLCVAKRAKKEVEIRASSVEKVLGFNLTSLVFTDGVNTLSFIWAEFCVCLKVGLESLNFHKLAEVCLHILCERWFARTNKNCILIYVMFRVEQKSHRSKSSRVAV